MAMAPVEPIAEATPDGGQDLIEGGEPFALFADWMAVAERYEPNDANAMALATVDDDGLPNVRMVLLKSAGPEGFVFYTNAGSKKGTELAASMKCAAVLHWKSLRRQIRFRGSVAVVADAEADAYFSSRQRGSRVGAWSSRQSQPLSGRRELEEAVAEQSARFAAGDVPRPPHWKGYRVTPVAIEFWMNKPFRLHDRLAYRRDTPAAPWTVQRLYP